MDYIAYKQKMGLNESFSERMKSAKELQEVIKIFANPDLKEHIIVLPSDDPMTGKIGYCIMTDPENESGVLKISCNVSIPLTGLNTEEIWCSNYEEFDKEFKKAYEHDWPITIAEDPVKRILGFVVNKGSERILYRLSYSQYKFYREMR